MMDDATAELAISTVSIDPNELAKCTPSEIKMYFSDFLALEKSGYISRERKPRVASACVDLDKYESFEHFVNQCRKVHKGNAVRDALKATRLGYYTKFFDFSSYTPDIVAINDSTPVRGGVAMTHYMRTVESYGGYPKRIESERIPDQAGCSIRRFGVFREIAGHRQGDIVSDEQLVAYISLRRRGNYALYSMILGHADHLANGIMYKMHLDLVNLILAARDQAAAAADASLRSLRGIRYLMYSAYYGIRPGLLLWKRRMLFEPFYMQFDFVAACPVDRLCAVAGTDIKNMEWQSQCARMLAETIERCLDQGRQGEAAVARAALAVVSKRLAAHAKESSSADAGAAGRDADHGRVVVVGPTTRWSEVAPEGSVSFDPGAPVLAYPQTGTTTGPSPLLRCRFPQQDNGEPVDIVIQVSGDEGNTNFRLKLGWLRQVDLGRLGIALPRGEAKVWAVHRRSPDAPWATHHRVDLRIDPDAANATDIA
jgi:hypothetical protein